MRDALPYVDPTAIRGRLYRAYAWFSATAPMRWVSRHLLWRLDPPVMRATGGRVGLAFGVPTALLETRGARTDQVRRNAVIYFHDGERVILVASKMGMPEHPAWFHNVRANPDVTYGGLLFRAEVVEDDAERVRLWALADRVFPPYAGYRERAARSGRTIPLVQLSPR